MEGSRYPNGVLVDRSALRYTELTKSAEILRDRVDWTSRGVYSGFEITVNGADTTKIDVAQGSGFTPSGEFIETDGNYVRLTLSDYTLATSNYVCAVYSETNTKNQPHETDGSTYPVRSEMSWRIRIYTAAEYNALSATDDNLSNDARDRIIIVGKVSANGAGNPLTVSSITSPTEYDSVLYATPYELVSIIGVDVSQVSADTTVGDGVLTYTLIGGLTPYRFSWNSFGGGAGVNVDIASDGYYQFPDGLSEYIRCYVVVSQLPLVTPITETITITNLYYQEVPRQTAEDHIHRSYVGTGTPSPTNPHGLAIDDIAGETVSNIEEHQDVMHCNGIWKGSSATTMQCSVNIVSEELAVQSPAAADLYYINGNKLNTIDITSIPFTPWTWTGGYDTRTNFFEIYVDSTEHTYAHLKASYPVAPRSLTGTWIVDMSPDYPAGNYNLTYGTLGLYLYIGWDRGPTVNLLATDFGVAGNSRVIRLWDEEREHWIDLYVNMESAPGALDYQFNNAPGPLTDIVEVVASPDQTQNMQIASLSYWYYLLNHYLGYGPYSVIPPAIRRVIDKRPWGTLCEDNIRDEALQDLIYHQQDEMHHSGVLIFRNVIRDTTTYGINEFKVAGSAGLTIDITAGSYYCRGQRLFSNYDTTTLSNNATNLVWVDMEGNRNAIDVTTDYGGDLSLAMQYVLGSSEYVPATDDETHSTDNIDSPERGVVLYEVVTAGAAISYYKDLTRNVNGPVDPWSVGDKAQEYTCRSAFNSLYAAFAYANVALSINPTETQSIDIHIIGLNEIRNASVVQPTGVNVFGSNLINDAKTNIYFADTRGAWRLSTGCKVKDVKTRSYVNTTAVFGMASAVDTECRYITIERCRHVAGMATVDYINIGEVGYAGSTAENIIVRDNDVSVSGSFLSATALGNALELTNTLISNNNLVTAAVSMQFNVATTSSGLIISDNYIDSTTNILSLQNCTRSIIKNNHLFLNNATGTNAYGIYLNGSDYCIVEGNDIEGVLVVASNLRYGIKLNGVSYLNINNNIIGGSAGGLLAQGIGADVVTHNNSSNVNINNNIIRAYFATSVIGGVGIFLLGYDIQILNNNIYAEGIGIGVGYDTGNSTNVDIIGNNIEVVTKNAAALAGFTIGNTGCDCISMADQSRDFKISNNDLKIKGDPSAGDAILDASNCIFLNTCDGFMVDNNKTRASCSSVTGTQTAFHIVAASPGGNGFGFYITNNYIDNLSNCSGLLNGLSVVDALTAAISIGYINGNFIYGSNDAFTAAHFEFSVASSIGGPWLVYDNNVITDITIGGATLPYIIQAGTALVKGTNNRMLNSAGDKGLL